MRFTMINSNPAYLKFYSRVRVWWKALRAPFFTASAVAVILGTAVAWQEGYPFLPGIFLLCLAGAVFIHAGANLANDYFDHRFGCDWLNPSPTPFSGGSRVIQQGLIVPRLILCAALACLAAGSLIGLFLNYKGLGNTILLIGIAGVGLALFYSAGPVRMSYNTLGELAVAVAFGPLIVLGSYYTQAGRISTRAILISIIPAVSIFLILFINEFPDFLPDKKAGKRTLVVVLGRERAVFIYWFLILLVYALTAGFIITGVLPWPSAAVFLTLPLALRAARIVRERYSSVYELLPANAATISLHLLTTILLSVSMVISRVFYV